MKVAFSERAIEALKDAPPAVRTAFDKQIRFLANDLHHPSLRAKKYDESRDLWQARVTRDWRFYGSAQESDRPLGFAEFR